MWYDKRERNAKEEAIHRAYCGVPLDLHEVQKWFGTAGPRTCMSCWDDERNTDMIAHIIANQFTVFAAPRVVGGRNV